MPLSPMEEASVFEAGTAASQGLRRAVRQICSLALQFFGSRQSAIGGESELVKEGVDQLSPVSTEGNLQPLQ